MNQIRLAIHGREIFAAGHAFGPVGAYERLDGVAHYAVDPRAAAQRVVVDLDKAPRNDQGLVEFSADICILKPLDPRKGNRRLFFGYGNRGIFGAPVWARQKAQIVRRGERFGDTNVAR